MVTGELKAQVDANLLFIRRLDDLQTQKENRANRLGEPIQGPIFPAGEDVSDQPYSDQALAAL